MHRHRWPWLTAAALLLCGAAAAAASVWVHWLPCRGSMLNGSVLLPAPQGSVDFTPGCLRAMDDGYLFVSSTSDRWLEQSLLTMTAILLIGAAWILVLLSSRWSRLTKLVGASPVVAGGVLGAVQIAGIESFPYVLLVSLDALAFVAFLVVLGRETLPSNHAGRVCLLLAATSAFGYVGQLVDYALIISTNENNWDTPPGGGYSIVLGIAAAAVLLVVLTLRPDREPEAVGARPEAVRV